jgi:hypothetical protein
MDRSSPDRKRLARDPGREEHNVSHESALASFRESYGRVVYSHKTHEKAAERLHGRITLLKWANLLLIVLTFGGVLNATFAGGPVLNILTVLVSALALALAIYRMSFNPERDILEHRKTANKLWPLREEFANLIGDITDEALSDQDMRQRRNDLTARLGQVYADAPPTTSGDYQKAQAALNPGEEMTFSKEEIDRFLPKDSQEPSPGP